MNPTEEPKPQASAPPPAVERELISQIITEMEASNPYGFGKYTDEDATFLGLPSLGSMRLAHTMVKQFLGTPFIPKFIANSPNPAGTFVATVLRGNELKFKMFESLSSLYLSPDGRLGMYGTAMLALMRKSGIHLEFTDLKDEKGEPTGCTVYGKRADGDEYTSTFTRVDAIRAGLTGMHGKYPQYMCKWRAVSDLFRTLASDLSGGPVYTTEELLEDNSTTNGNQPERAQPEAEADPYAVALPEPALLKPESAAPAARMPAAEIPISEKTYEAPASTEVPTPQAAPVVAPSDAPAAPQAPQEQEPPKVREMPKPKIDPRVGPLMAEIEKLLPVKGRKKIVEEYLRGYFNTGDIKTVLGDSRMPDALLLLRALALSDQWKTPLAGDPHKLGVDAAAGCAKLRAYMEGWPEDCQETAFRIALARYSDDAGALVEYLQDPIQAETLGFGDLRVFLVVLDRLGAQYATMLRERAVSMADAAAEWTAEKSDSEIAKAIEALPESEPQQNLLDLIRKGAE